jgi:prolyl-tRNA synthetase
VGAHALRPANADELAATGIVAGYASPIGVEGTTVVADDLVALSANLVAGANKPGYHLLNTNVPRDYQPDIVADIAAAFEGAPCPGCNSPVRLVRGVEVGNTFKLGTKYSKALGATFLDEQGQQRDIVMASYGIGVGRLMACIAQGSHDDRGLIWPLAVAPFQVYLVGLDLHDDQVRTAAEAMYAGLGKHGIEVLYDDRDERAGVKFNDADLLGIPLRVTISLRTLQKDAVELKARTSRDAEFVALGGAVRQIRRTLSPGKGLRRQVLSERLGQYLAELDKEFGPLTEEEIEEGRRLWNGEP